MAGIVWAGLLFMQHLSCFDLFYGNLWYLYLLAAGFAAAQYGLLFPLRKLPGISGLYGVCHGVYCAFAFVKGFQIIMDPASWGLSLTCCMLDILGAVWVSWLNKQSAE